MAVPSAMQWWQRMISALPPSTSSTTQVCHSGSEWSSGALAMSLTSAISAAWLCGAGRAMWCRCWLMSKSGMSCQWGVGSGNPVSTTRWRKRSKVTSRSL